MNKLISIFAPVVTLSATNISQGSETYLETDPLTWMLNGRSLNIKRSSTIHNNVTVGLGYFSLELPDIMIDQNRKNKNKGWDVAVNNGYEFYIDYYLSDPDKGWFTGLQMSLYDFEIEKDKNKSNFNSVVSLWRSGYLWRPAGTGFYLMPWAAIGYTQKSSGSNNVNGEKYDVEPVVLFATLYLGYSF